MSELERYLCETCRRMLDDAQLVYKKVPNTEGEKQYCDWCRYRRFGARYKIQFGRGRT